MRKKWLQLKLITEYNEKVTQLMDLRHSYPNGTQIKYDIHYEVNWETSASQILDLTLCCGEYEFPFTASFS